MAVAASRTNPYIGPRSFKTGEKLYGRERETSELLDLLIAERIVLLYSPSGAGKSSLVQSALLPQLRAEGFRVHPPIRVNLEPPADVTRAAHFNRYLYSVLASLEDTLPPERKVDPEVLVNMSLAIYLEQRPNLEPPPPGGFCGDVFLFDQFEEILTLDPSDAAAKHAFFAQVGQALRLRQRWALFAMREDYVAALDPHLRDIPTRFANTYRLDLLGVEAARAAIQAPAQTQGVEFLTPAARQLINDLRRTQTQAPDGSIQTQLGLYVEPVQLQVVCYRLWENLPATDDQIDSPDVAKIGNADTALADYYANRAAFIAAQTHVDERVLREWCQSKLITPQGIRGQVLLGQTDTEGLPNAALRALESAYIIRAETRGGAIWFELAHDRLIQPVQHNNATWFEKNLSPLQRAAALWGKQNRPEGLLMEAKSLTEAEQWIKAGAGALTPVEQQFLEASRQRVAGRQRAHRAEIAIRWLAIGASLLAAIAIFLVFYVQRIYVLAAARQLANAALYNIPVDPEISALLALHSAHTTDNNQLLPETINALHQSLEAMRIQGVYAGHAAPVLTCNFDSNKARLVTTSEDGTAIVWDAVQQTALFTTTRYASFVTGAAFTPERAETALLAVASAVGQVDLFDANTFAHIATLPHASAVMAVAFSPAGPLLATGDEHGTLTLWDTASHQPRVTTSPAHDDLINALAFSVDGQIVASASDDGRVKLWEVSSGRLVKTLESDLGKKTHEEHALDVAFSPDGKWIATAGSDRVVRVWDLVSPDFALALTYANHTNWVWSVAFSPDGRRVASASADRAIQVWDPKTGAQALNLTGSREQVYDANFDVWDRQLVTCGKDELARVWNVGPSAEKFTLNPTSSGDPTERRLYVAAFSPNGQTLVTGGRLDYGTLWDFTHPNEARLLNGHTSAVEWARFSPDSQRLATASRDGTTRLWRVADGSLLALFDVNQLTSAASLANEASWLYGVDFDPTNPDQIATSGRDGVVRVWDANIPNAPVKTLVVTDVANSGYANSVFYAPSGQQLLVAYDDGYVREWDRATGQILHQWQGFLTRSGESLDDVSAQANFALYSPNEQWIAVGSEDGAVFLFDRASPTPALTLTAHIGAIYALAFSADSRLLASGGGDKTIRLWDIADRNNPVTFGRNDLILYGHTDRIYALDFSRDGHYLLSASADNTARVYVLDPAELIALTRQRLTRGFTPEECNRFYLTEATCQP